MKKSPTHINCCVRDMHRAAVIYEALNIFQVLPVAVFLFHVLHTNGCTHLVIVALPCEERDNCGDQLLRTKTDISLSAEQLLFLSLNTETYSVNIYTLTLQSH